MEVLARARGVGAGDHGVGRGAVAGFVAGLLGGGGDLGRSCACGGWVHLGLGGLVDMVGLVGVRVVLRESLVDLRLVDGLWVGLGDGAVMDRDGGAGVDGVVLLFMVYESGVVEGSSGCRSTLGGRHCGFLGEVEDGDGHVGVLAL